MNSADVDPIELARDIQALKIQRPIDVGGQKAVWKCKYNNHDSVLKVIIVDAESTERAKRELDIMRACESARIARVGPLPLSVRSVQGDEAVIFYLEEYIEGRPLDQVEKPLAEEEVVNLGICTAEAIVLAMGHVAVEDSLAVE